MAKQNSFDVVSEVDLEEVRNAVNQSMKEIVQRFDLKGSNSTIELDDKAATLTLASADEFRLQAVNDILQKKLVRRGVSLKALSYGTVDPAAKGTVRQTVTLQQEHQAQGPSGDPAGHRAGLRQGSGHPAGHHRPAQGARLRHRHAVHQLPVELKPPGNPAS